MEGGTIPHALLLGIIGTGIPSSMLLEKLPDDTDISVKIRFDGIEKILEVTRLLTSMVNVQRRQSDVVWRSLKFYGQHLLKV